MSKSLFPAIMGLALAIMIHQRLGGQAPEPAADTLVEIPADNYMREDAPARAFVHRRDGELQMLDHAVAARQKETIKKLEEEKKSNRSPASPTADAGSGQQ